MNPEVPDIQRDHGLDQSQRPFKEWALQQDLTSLLESDPTWQVDASAIRLDAKAKDSKGNLRGQSYLSRRLDGDIGLGARMLTSASLWVAALAITSLNQWTSFGLTMESMDFEIVVGGMLAALALVAIAFPLLSQRNFLILEEGLLLWAIGLIAFQASVTGGADSPYAVWLVFAALYAAYFQSDRLFKANTAIAVAVALAPLAYEPSQTTGYAVLFAVLLATTIVLLSLTVIVSRRLTRRANRTVKFLALADRLTGVANRRAFEEFTAELEQSGTHKFAIVMLDMNGLKGANTVFGYATGDGMVVRLARLLLQVSPPSSQVARIGGDEFAVVFPDCGAEDLAEWQDNFDAAMKAHNENVRGQLPQISVAIGAASAPEDGPDSHSLLDVADRRMYVQKAQAVPAAKPPAEFGAPAPIDGSRLFATERAPDRSTPKRGPGAYAYQAGTSWTVTAVGLLMWLTVLDVPVPYPTLTLLCCVFSFIVAAINLAGIDPRYRHLTWRISDFSTLLLIIPGLWVTGGWESPFQLTLIVTIAYYAQFFRGPGMLFRIGSMMILYSIAFWATGPVSDWGYALYATMITAMGVIAVILPVNVRNTSRTLRMIRESATRDALTGARNLYAFRKDLIALVGDASTHAGEFYRHPALILIDLDEFDRVNLEVGHRGGDAVLKESIRRLETAVGAGQSTVYRIGGDDFAVLLTVDRFSEVSRLAERCRRALTFKPPEHLEVNRQIAASVGFSVLRDGMSAEELVIDVESALTQGKTQRGDAFSNDTSVML